MAAGSLRPSRMAGLSPNALGALFVVIGSLGYVTNDALGAVVHLDFAIAQTLMLVVPFAVTLTAALVLGGSLAVLGAAACLTVRGFATGESPTRLPPPSSRSSRRSVSPA